MLALENRLIANLKESTYQKLLPHIKQVELRRGKLIRIADETIKDVYFPIDCLLSITITMSSGTVVETGIIGSDGMIGINAIMGRNTTTQTEYSVQISGSAIQIDAHLLQQEFQQNEDLRNVLLNYTQALIAQISQTAACNCVHTIEQRLPRWLLSVQKRIKSNQFYLTQDLMSQMLGVRRAGITIAAQKLQDRGLISYSRGNIRIVDLLGLEAASCECFSMVEQEYERLLGITQSTRSTNQE